jgi:TetR/AcrR family transcriptional regulator, fatty acid metabolism regulator protein
MSNSRKEKINHILQAALMVLATKGYENSTIADISKAANVSRGILHYYFTDKEDLVSKVLANASSKLVQSALAGIKGKSQEEMIDNILSVYIKNLEKNPDFYAFLFEMWCASRRSEKIRKELQSCISKVVDAIRKILEDALKNSMVKFDAQKSDEMAKALLALSDGIAFHMLINPSENLKDKKFWLAIRNMMLGVLKR